MGLLTGPNALLLSQLPIIPLLAFVTGMRDAALATAVGRDCMPRGDRVLLRKKNRSEGLTPANWTERTHNHP